MDEIMDIAAERSLFVVEDVAQAFGGVWNGKKLGSIGTCGAFSFFPSKNLGGFGDGGMVSTNDDEVAALIRMLLKHGGRDKYNVDHIGYNTRLDTFQAAILLAKFKYLDEFNARRRHIAQNYTEGLKDIPGIVVPSAPVEAPCAMPSALCSEGHVFHQFTIRVLDSLPDAQRSAPSSGPAMRSAPCSMPSSRDRLQSHLREHGIDSMVYYPVPLHQMKVFEGRYLVHGTLKESERAAQQVLSLPIEPLMDSKDIAQITGKIAAACKQPWLLNY